MKNIFVIISLVILFFALVFSAYIAGFNLYFSSSRLNNSTKRLSRMIFQRDVKISGMSFSPFGSFKARSFIMASKGGFDNGVQLSINKVEAKINLKKLLRREFSAEDLFIDGLNLNLNYERGRKFNYGIFFSNIQYVLMKDGDRTGLLKGAEIKNMEISNASVDLLTDRGVLKFKNISLLSGTLESGGNFDGNVYFDFEYGGKRYNANFKFNYNSKLREINFSEFKCEELSLYAVGNIVLLDNGESSLYFKIDGNRELFDGVFKNVVGSDYLRYNDSSSEQMSEIEVEYPGTSGNDKEHR